MPLTSVTTGRYLVLLCSDKPREGARRLAELARVRVVHSRRRGAKPRALSEHCALVFDHIGVALLRCTPEAHGQLASAALAGDEAILAVEPERSVSVGSRENAVRNAYLRGYRDAVEDLSRRLLQEAAGGTDDALVQDAAVSWGVRAVAADRSPFSGKGIRIAVLDTGLDARHPDFAGRAVSARSFIEGETAQDGNGHGTHCAGIAAGPVEAGAQPRYGVAGEAELYVGKVLGDDGSGADGSVLQGIDWAMENHCHVISLSLGSPAQPGQSYSAVFEAVAQRALAAGSLIVAAAGNESRRPEFIAPVGHPANCPSILAVAAIDSDMTVAPFSCGGLEADGGEVNIAAPGVDIPSSWPMPARYHVSSGTSMATPFVAGVAALYAQADPSVRGTSLRERLMRHARPLPDPERDVGAGLVRAPPEFDHDAVSPLRLSARP